MKELTEDPNQILTMADILRHPFCRWSRVTLYEDVKNGLLATWVKGERRYSTVGHRDEYFRKHIDQASTDFVPIN